MKTNIPTKLPAALAIAVGLGLSASALGMHQSGRSNRDREDDNQNPVTATMHSTGKMLKRTGHAAGTALSKTGKSAERALSRTGQTMRHTPAIIGETFSGERKFVSEKGFFARSNPETVAEKSESRFESDQTMSIPQGRGQRLQVGD